MAAQSGITPTTELNQAWATALSTPTTRIVKISIDKEQLIPSQIITGTESFEADFSLLESSVEPKTPAYLLYRLESTPTSSWIFYSYVPDDAPVRAKMLYASTRTTLGRSLGDSRFATSIFATSVSDLTATAYKAHQAHLSSEAPLTTREKEMQEIREAEAKEQRESGGERSSGTGGPFSVGGGAGVGGASVGLEWSDEAREEVEELVKGEGGEGGVVQLSIEKEKVILLEPQPTTLSLPPSQPSYTFYRHAAGLVFIYSCPPTSPIKSRLVYSSSSSGVVQFAKSLGAQVLKKIETSDPSEIDDAYITEELGPLATPTSAAESAPGSGANTPLSPDGEKPSFARPARPGRKR